MKSHPVLWFCDDCDTSGCFAVTVPEFHTIPIQIRDEHESRQKNCESRNVQMLGQVKDWLQTVRREFPG